MSPFFRAVTIYLFLMLALRITGKRSLAQVTTFDLVLLLVIGEATQQALLGDDFSVTNGLVVITTLISMEILFSLLKRRSKRLQQWLEGPPSLLVENGRPIAETMSKEHVDEEDVMEAARELQGLERMDQIRSATLERGGHISIVPKSPSESDGERLEALRTEVAALRSELREALRRRAS